MFQALGGGVSGRLLVEAELGCERTLGEGLKKVAQYNMFQALREEVGYKL